MTHIMLDLETLSSEPDAAIVSIGACTFYHEGERDTFYCTIDPVSAQAAGGRVDASTVLWWMRQSAEAREKTFFAAEQMTIYQALDAFDVWIGKHIYPQVWGNGADFDNVVLRESYKQIGQNAPWRYTNSRCYRTLKSLTNIPRIEPHIPHHALYDAIAQAEHAEMILNKMRNDAVVEVPA